jgi:hypothetical protein
MLRRGRFRYTLKDIFVNLLKCLCIKENRELRGKLGYRKHLLFNRGT